MTKKISEMELDELRDFAVKLQEDKDALSEDLKQKDVQINDLHDLNKALQKRNNDLFLKVEQQVTPKEQETSEPATVQSCEELAKNKFKEIIR